MFRISHLAVLTAFSLVATYAAAEDITIKHWTLKNPNGPEFVAQAAASFEEANPGVTILHEDFPNEAYKTAVQVALTGSEPPDSFFNWVGEDTARFIREGLALDITGYGTGEEGFQNVLSEGWLSSMRVDDKLYGVPMEANSKFVYYNPTFFAEHELEVPESFEELLATCGAVREIDSDLIPLPLGNSERWKVNHFITILNERMVGFEETADDYDLSASEHELFADPGYVAAWQKLLDLQDAGCFQDAPNATSPEISRAMFSAGAAPMIYCGSWCAGIFDSEGFTDYALFRMPTIEGGKGDPDTNLVFVQGYQVSSKSKNPEMTVAWLSHLVSPDVAKSFAESMGRIPSNPVLLAESDQLTEQFKWIAEDISQVSAAINPLDILLENTVSEAYLDAGVEVLNATMTAEEAMEKIRGVALEAKSRL